MTVTVITPCYHVSDLLSPGIQDGVDW